MSSGAGADDPSACKASGINSATFSIYNVDFCNTYFNENFGIKDGLVCKLD